MVSVSESTADELEEIAESKDVELDEVREEFKEKYNELQDNSQGLPESKVEEIALRTTRTSTLSSDRISTDDVEMLTIGGSIREWDSGDTFVGKALVDPNPDTDSGAERLASVIVDSDHVELAEIYDAFSEVGNVVTGNFSVSEGDIEPFLVLNSGDNTEIELTKPDDRAPLIEEIREAVPETSLASAAEDLSATTRDDDGDVYPANFGVDIRRIEADVYDGYKNPDSNLGIYTIRDDTLFDEEDIADSDVYDAETANENATPGMTCFGDSDDMEHGTGSVLEIYGVVEQGDDGVQMNIDGIIPIYSEEFDGYVDSSDDEEDSSRGEAVETNADRTKI